MSDYNITGPDVLSFRDGNRTLPLVIMGSIAIGSMLVHLTITFILKRVAAKTGWTFDEEVVKHCAKPSFITFPIGTILITLPFVSNVDLAILYPIRHALAIVLIIFVTWTVVGFAKAVSITISKNNDFIKSSHELQARKLQTQLTVCTRIAYIVIFLIGASCILLTFPKAWEIGVGILASASVTAIFVGFAAKPSIENLIASLQIALTQPLLLDDYVSFGDCEGIVEEIQAQFIVVRTGDDKRLIIPLIRIINETFENWSKTSQNITATFELYVDYGVPLNDLRQQFMMFVQKHECWDHRDASLKISKAGENFLVLKAAMTTSNVRNLFKIQNDIREQLIEYLVVTHPHFLPRMKYENLQSRVGVDSMKKIVTKMEDPELDSSKDIEKLHFLKKKS
ncbi:783_t:CDS:2 [Entrophospora sp. SA101]|nr:10891_t:CDS:2 [Entrophospora sp. SA101]CAJ0644402.1 783_t:CDS:2 [Entrophospora sp. SA101]CAJ0829748.1 3499_t:CDS:2 [Entrophospora sp. SA101]CAJ0916549.1 8731_t:CDS:2 [Entrophospora sp. SA101]